MAGVRGISLLDAQEFVRQSYGLDAHGRELTALDPDTRELFAKPIKEEAWYPLVALTAYLTAARQALDPGAPDFFRREASSRRSDARAAPWA